MSEMNKIKNLVNILNTASDAYYNSGDTIMSDIEFDALLSELKILEEQTGLTLSNSPTHNVGATILSEQHKVEHKIPMLSLDKCHNIDNLVKFAGNDDCYLSLKLDGLSTRLIYSNGQLVKAATRGDGIIGSDITEHIKQYDNIPININYKDNLIIDGESLILYSDFNEINDLLPENEQFKNARNLASGTLSLLDMNIVKKRHMKFMAWRVIDGLNDIEDSHLLKLKAANKLGFDIVDIFQYSNKSNNKEQLLDILHCLRKSANNKNIPIDGIVMAKDSIQISEQMGRTSKFFKHSIAYKFEDEEYMTKLTDVDFTIGKTGCLTPTAIFTPIVIDGTTVERASLANLSIIKKLGLTRNCTVFIRKANCIIPQITRSLQDGDSEIHIPEVCPICNKKTIIVKENTSEVLMCDNAECLGKLLGKLKFFVSKPAVNIDGLSESTLEFLLQKQWVKSFVDIYHLSNYKSEWEKCNGFGKKSVEKILNAIEASRNIDLAHFICSLSIPNIGLSAAKTISKACYGSFDVFIQAYRDDFDWTTLDDFGAVMCYSLENYIEHNFEQINILAKEMHFIEQECKEVAETKFTGKSICVTGKLEHFTRDSINEKIISIGAKVASSVSKKTDYLITNEQSGSSKYKKAIELNIPIITEEEFLKMLG